MLTYSIYDIDGTGEILIANDGRTISIYNHLRRQGWFAYREAEILTIDLQGDFKVSAYAASGEPHT